MPTVSKSTKAKAAPGPSKGHHGALMSTNELMAATGYGSPAIHDLRTQGIIHSEAKGRWPIIATLGAMVRRLRSRQEATGSEDRARRNKSEANIVELNEIKALGETCLMSDAKLFWSEDRIAIRQAIERAPYLTQDAKKKLLAEIAKIHPAELESEA